MGDMLFSGLFHILFMCCRYEELVTCLSSTVSFPVCLSGYAEASAFGVEREGNEAWV